MEDLQDDEVVVLPEQTIVIPEEEATLPEATVIADAAADAGDAYAAILLRRVEFRVVLRPVADYRVRWGGAAGLLNGRVYALNRAGLPHAACLVARRAVAVRRDGPGLYVAAV